MKNKPVVVLKRRRVCENSKFEIFFDHIKWANGEVVPDYLVAVPKNQAGRHITGVSVLPVLEGRIGLIKLYRHAVGDFFWEVPRGFIDAGENPETAAIRELQEETGLKCQGGGLLDLGFIAPEAGIFAATIQLFAALRCIQIHPYTINEVGHQEFRFFRPAEVMAMIEHSEIQDPSTIAAYFKYLNRFENP